MQNRFNLTAAALTSGLLVWPRLSPSIRWRAMVTPLASIIGSGFLALGSILNGSYGKYAPRVMLGP